MRHVDRELRRHPPGRRDRGLRDRGGRALAVIDHPRPRGFAGAAGGRSRSPRRDPAMTRGDQQPSQRQLRVAEQMRHLLAEHLIRGELHDPRLARRHLTVAEVRVSRDLKSATVFTTELGGELTRRRRRRPCSGPRLSGRLARAADAPEIRAPAALRRRRDLRLRGAHRIGCCTTHSGPRPEEDDADGAP